MDAIEHEGKLRCSEHWPAILREDGTCTICEPRRWDRPDSTPMLDFKNYAITDPWVPKPPRP